MAAIFISALVLTSTPGTASAANDEASEIAARSQADYPAAHEGFAQALAAEDCGVRVDWPHPSRTTNNQIHTRVESFCNGSVLVNNTITGKSYRSRWYGWQHVKTETTGPKNTWRVRVTVDVDCGYGTWHRWRTEGYGSGLLNGQPVSASAYQQNDDEIMCGDNN
ncbi:hypothetical protein [Nocardiopsis sp. LOL_012]|uniref:hypothetical protein n=1 Tax=Nocardiopsis sp. LOL_012 TaxID=3345409 RepID=UPI003A8C6A28